MTIYLYHHVDQQGQETVAQLEDYAQSHGFRHVKYQEANAPVKMHWRRREIGELINGTLEKGDELVVYQATDIARSTCQMLEVLMALSAVGAHIHFVKYDRIFYGNPENSLKGLLCLMQDVEGDYISRRTTDALARRREAGLPLGRPKGRRNKSLKLDRYRKEIMRYLDLQISKASIAKLVGCHPQTLYDWIERHQIPDKKPRRPRRMAGNMPNAIPTTSSKSTEETPI